MGNRLIFLYHHVVNVLFRQNESDGGTQEGRPSAGWKWRFKLVGGRGRQIHPFVNTEKG